MRRILLSVYMENFSPVDWDEIQETQPKEWNVILNRARLSWPALWTLRICLVHTCDITT